MKKGKKGGKRMGKVGFAATKAEIQKDIIDVERGMAKMVVTRLAKLRQTLAGRYQRLQSAIARASITPTEKNVNRMLDAGDAFDSTLSNIEGVLQDLSCEYGYRADLLKDLKYAE